MKILSEKLVNRQIAREYKKLLKISYQTLNNDDKNLIRRALDLAIDAHKDQYRKSGEPYVFHPISVAKIKNWFGCNMYSCCSSSRCS